MREPPLPFAVPERLDTVDSTNTYLVELARSGLPDGSAVPAGHAVVAEYQREGRGRLARSWRAPAGSAVLCSILFKPDLPPDQLHLTAWAVALAAVQACRETAGVELSLKWPNDLVAEPGAMGDWAKTRPGATREAGASGATALKVAGILSEIVPPPPGAPDAGAAQGSSWVVVGIGINVNWPEHWPPPCSCDPDLASIAACATSLNRIAGRQVDRGELLGRLLASAGTRNAELASDRGRRALASEFRHVCSTIGREVRVELPGETVTGRALDVDDSGCLLVSVGACVRTVSAGDVVHVR